jgi:hypothetical protein
MADLDISLFWEDSPDLWDSLYLGESPLPGIARVNATHGRKLDSKSAPGSNGARIVDKGYQPAKVEIVLRMWRREQLEAWQRLAPTLTYRREPPRSASRSGTQTKEQLEQARRVELVRASVEAINVTELAASGATAEDLARKQTAWDAQRQAPTRSARARSLERHDFAISHPALDTLQIHRVYIEEVSTPNPTGTPGVYEVKIKALESKAPSRASSRSVGSTTAGSFAAGIQTAFGASDPVASGAARP